MATRVTPTTPPPAAPARTAPTTGRPLLNLVKKIMPGPAGTTPGGSLPAHRPADRTPATVDSIDTYTPGVRVWAYIGSAWLPATVASTDGSCALVTYAVPGSGDTMVEIVHATGLHLRDRPIEDCRCRGGTTPASGAPNTGVAPDAGQARTVLSVHRADEHGMCTACAYLAHFCWAPCPQARQAMSVLATAPATRIGAP